ncbi:unknown [Bacteroides sp. CAG:633]|nr:unknown [Bacteroides sp. CAG:633]
MVLTEVEPLGDALVVVALEFLAIELAYEIFRSTTAEGATGVDVDNHHPLHVVLVAIDRQLYKVGTFKLVGLYAITFAKLAEVFPVLHVGGRVETHVLVGRNNHVPLLCGFVPEDFRVAEVLQSVERSQDGVLFVLGVGAAVVVAVGHALYLSVLVAGRGVESNHGVLAVAGAVVLVDNGATREDVSQRVACDGRVEVFPMNEVAADGVSPVHVAPLRSVGVVLEVQVIFAVFVDQTVGVVHPAIERRVVINGTVIIGIGSIESIGQADAVPADGVSCHATNGYSGFFGSLRQGERHVILHAVYSQTHVHRHVGRTAGIEFHLTLGTRFLNGEDEVFLGIANVNDGECIALMFEADTVVLRLAGAECGNRCQSHCQMIEIKFHGCNICFICLKIRIKMLSENNLSAFYKLK